ncbi:sugar efflux transporter [Asanoa sp. WMMD1127]|uniref:sugar efflux transporter n=1 Tax=Asanoa sp. WMMD1127 TaxID=3016107 RepID=UPI002416F810|nr:sugar efflux transporter [Asanoa sp. WMMD1127]MDG4825032.1 sugar efflux transporter [Asanoa sp. WMMD1127]
MLLLGIADSMVGPYLVLFGTKEVGLSPLRVGIFMSLVAASGLVLSAWLGGRYDRSASRWPAFVAVVAPALGYLALAEARSYPLLLFIAVGLLGAGMAAFAQLFTLARTHLDRSGSTSGRRGTPALRSVWSVAWAIGPLIGAAVLEARGFRGLMGLTALAFALVSVPLLLLGATPPAPVRLAARDTDGRLRAPVLLAAAAFTLFHTAMLSGSVVLPLFLTRTLDRADSDVGLLFSVCALVEIPVALSLMFLPAKVRKERLIDMGMLLFVAYFALVAVSSSLPSLVVTQVARGAAIAVVGALGITHMQDLLPQATGRATALFANTLAIGSLVSGVLAGAAAQLLGHRPALLLCGVLSAVGSGLLIAGRRAPSGTGPRTDGAQ